MTEKRILLVQFAGDFREAHRLLEATGTETYYGHRYVLEQLARIRAEQGEVAILCCLSGSRYQEVLPSGVTVMGADAHPEKQSAAVIAMMEAFRPTHVVVLTPMPRILRWARRSGARVLCQFADSFNVSLLRRWWRFGRLHAQLNDPVIEWVSNHGRNACASLVRIGVDPAKVLPWDWPQARRPHDRAPKPALPEGRPTLFFAGEVIALKGVGDTIEAVAALKRRGRDVALQIAGRGQHDRFRAHSERLGVGDRVDILGVIPNTEVIERMRAAAAVIVPSRHGYPEGLPLTIYEALCARTPLVASDHPMFLGNLVDRETALIYPAGEPARMADRIEELLDAPDLYATLSRNAEAGWERLQVPTLWGDLIFRWIADAPEDRAWLASHTIKT